jgi:ABC-type sugar transport system, periplasmic component
MKKNLFCLLALLIALSMIISLPGCSSNTASGNTSATVSAGSTAAEGSTQSSVSTPVTLTFWNPLSTMADYYQGMADRYHQATGNTVEVTAMENDAYKDKIKVAMGAGTMPDIISHWAGGPMNAYVDAGVLLDLTDYMNKDNYKDRWLDATIKLGTYKDKIWALGAGDLMTFPIFYNKEIFKKYGFSEPKTVEELETMCDKFVADGLIPFALANMNKWTGSVYYMYLVDRIGGSTVFSNAAGRINGGSFKDETFTLAGKKLQDWVKKGYFPEGTNGLNNANGQDRQLFYSGKAVMWSYPTSVISVVMKEAPDFYSKIDVMNFPSYSGGKGDSTAVVGSAGQNFFSISAQCKAPDAAWTFLQEMGSDETVAEGLKIGRCVPVKGIFDKVTEPLRQKALNFLSSASSVQLAYDQYLTPTLGELHKSTCQELFGLTLTPEQVNQKMEDAAVAEYGK